MARVQHYDIEESFIGRNCRNARIKFEGSQKWLEVSVISYDKFADAEKQKARSIAIGSIMARPITIVDDNTGGFLLFVERLHCLIDEKNVWKFEKGKSVKDVDSENMWKIVDGKYIGFSDYYRSILQQIALGLLTIHSHNYGHGTPGDEVMYGADGKVRLYDLDVNAVGSEEYLREDFLSFKSLLRRFVKFMPVPETASGVTCLSSKDGGLRVTHDIQCYFDLINKFKTSSKEYCKWFYNPPVFWSANEKALFVNNLSRIMKKRPDLAKICFNCPELQSWVPQRILGIDPKSALRKAFNYRPNSSYMYPYGSIVFGRNFLEHGKLGTTIFDRFELVFPELISLVYRDLIEGITYGVYHSKQGSQFIKDDRDKLLSVEEFLWREPSIFRSYNT